MVSYRMSLAALGLTASTVLASRMMTKRGDTSGCGKSHHNGYNTNGGSGFPLSSNGLDRTYTIRVPDNYDPNRQYPLIVDYHGASGSSDGQYYNSRYDQYDDGKTNFIAVYPQGDGGYWEGASYATPARDDVKFTTDLIAHLESEYCIDSSRIYASGKSNGGGFVGTLACDPAGGVFAAFAMASAALYTDNLGDSAWQCSPARAQLPIMESHGYVDGTIPYNGGTGNGGDLPAIPAWLEKWSERDGCSANTGVTTDNGNGVHTTEYSCNGATNIVTGVEIDSLGHCWPVNDNGATNTDSSKENCGSSPLDYTPMVLSFFNSWDINGARSQ